MHRFFLKLRRRRTLHRDLEAELAFHREMAQAQGNPIPLGNTTVLKEQALDSWRFNAAENLWRDLVYAVRALRRTPGFVLAALLSLALGIGANTTIFSLALELLMSAPSVKSPETLVAVRLGGSSHAKPRTLVSLRDAKLFQDVAGENEETFLNWNDGRETRRIFSVVATPNYFELLGVPLLYGRGWTSADPKESVVLKHHFWKKHFGGDPHAVGRAMRLDGRLYTILGILPESHRTLLGFGFSPDVYVPQYDPDTLLAIYGRAKPGMTTGEIRSALTVVAERLDAEFPERLKLASDISVEPLGGVARVKDQGRKSAPFFIMLLAVTGLVLCIACVNVAGLLFARSQTRQHEIAIRLSLGAGRGRLLQQLLAESFLLSLLGGAAGFALAYAAAEFLGSFRLPLPLPLQLQIDPDWRVLAYSGLLASAAAVGCGLAPALQAVRESLNTGLRKERRLTLRRALVVVQVSLSVIVLATGFLFLRNLLRSNAVSPGFDVTRTVRAEVHLPPAAYKDPLRKSAFIGQALRELKSIPGVEAVAAARIIPFTDATRYGATLTFNEGTKTQTNFHWNAVSPAYFDAMAIPLLSGRPFAPQDDSGERAVIVNRTFAERYLPQRDPLGASFRWDDGGAVYRIVGVAADTRNITIGEEPRPQLYQPLSQIQNDRTRIQFVLRSTIPPPLQVAPVRDALRRIEPAAGLEVATMYSSIGMAFLPSQIGAALLGTSGVLGLSLAAIGLYGVLAYSVSRRSREIGVRIALGARTRDIAAMVLSESAKLILTGSALGLAVAFFVTKPLAMFLVPGLSPADPVSFLGVLAALALCGLLAALGPAHRAVHIDPVRSLRQE